MIEKFTNNNRKLYKIRQIEDRDIKAVFYGNNFKKLIL